MGGALGFLGEKLGRKESGSSSSGGVESKTGYTNPCEGSQVLFANFATSKEFLLSILCLFILVLKSNLSSSHDYKNASEV